LFSLLLIGRYCDCEVFDSWQGLAATLFFPK
jgi:hypothetical protein